MIVNAKSNYLNFGHKQELDQDVYRQTIYVHMVRRGSDARKSEPQHEIFNNVVCATSNASDQPTHTRSLIRAFANRLIIIQVLNYLEFLSFKGGSTGSSESTLVKLPHCWKSHVTAHLLDKLQR